MKSIKRAMAMCAAATLAFGAMSVMPASAAADSVDVKLSPSNETVEAGDEFTVTVDFTNADNGIVAFDFKVTYDDSVFEFVPTSDGNYPYIEIPDDLEDDPETDDVDESDPEWYVNEQMKPYKKENRYILGQVMGPASEPSGAAAFNWLNGAGTNNKKTTNPGNIVELTFKVKEGATAKDYTIDVSDASFIYVDKTTKTNTALTVNTTAASVKVTAPEVAVTGLTVTPETIEFAKTGLTQAITAVVSPNDATDKTVTYTSSKPSVATVSDDGVVTAVAEGTAVITATAGTISKTINVSVAHTHVTTKVDAVAATCQKEGNKEYYKCDCGKIFEDAAATKETTKAAVTLAKLDHEFTKKVMSDKTLKSAGTCTKKAVYYYTCALCEDEISDTLTFEGDLDENKHGETEIVGAVAADYFKDGYTGDKVCKDCGKVLEKGTKINMLLPTKVAAKAATCTEAGNKEYYKGGDKLYTSDDPETAVETTLAEVTIPATGHNFGEPTYTFSVDKKTCTAKRVCKNADAFVETETVNVKETVVKAPTYDAEGESKYTATFTNPAFKEQTITETTDALKHDYTPVEAKAATCTEDGNIAYYVRDDGKLYSDLAGTQEVTEEQVKIPATGHDFVLDPASVQFNDDFTVCKATLKCKNDASHTQDVESTNIEILENVDPSCTEDGYTKYVVTFGDETVEYTQTKEALGHTWGEWEIVEEATEEKDGLKKRTCSVCKTEETEVIPALAPADDGKTDDGKTDDGKTDDGKTDDGKTDDGKTDDGKTDDGKKSDDEKDDGKKSDDKKTDAGKDTKKDNGTSGSGSGTANAGTATGNPVTGAAAAFGGLAAAIGAFAIFKKRK